MASIMEDSAGEKAVESAPLATSACESFPASRKIYAAGCVYPEIRVPMRQISLSPSDSVGPDGNTTQRENAPITVYDTSGIYTDPDATIDLTRGLPPHREAWIRARNDVEEYEGRAIAPQDNGTGILN